MLNYLLEAGKSPVYIRREFQNSGIWPVLIVSLFYRLKACQATLANSPVSRFRGPRNQMFTEPQATRPVDRPAPNMVVDKENRRIQRISLPLPVRVEVKIDAQISWNEI